VHASYAVSIDSWDSSSFTDPRGNEDEGFDIEVNRPAGASQHLAGPA